MIMCVCVREIERETEGETEGETEREREQVRVSGVGEEAEVGVLLVPGHHIT